jgi:hypothetical protein
MQPAAWFKFRKAAFDLQRNDRFDFQIEEDQRRERERMRRLEVPLISAKRNEFPILAKHMRVLLIDAYRRCDNNIDCGYVIPMGFKLN